VSAHIPGPAGEVFPLLIAPGEHQRPADPAVLERLGIDPALLERVRRHPNGFVTEEAHLTQGADLRLIQQSPDPQRSSPDPDAPFTVIPIGQDFGQGGTGCLASLLGAGAVIALALSLLLLAARFG
jgi:hypothetical protein